MELFLTKTMVALLFLLLRPLSGILPVILKKILTKWENSSASVEIKEQRRKIVEKNVILIQSMGSGIFLAACFLHIMKHLTFSIKLMMKDVVGRRLKSSFPISQMALCIGFFSVYFLEEIAHWFIDKKSCEICQKKIYRCFNKKSQKRATVREKKDKENRSTDILKLNNDKVRPMSSNNRVITLDDMELKVCSQSIKHNLKPSYLKKVCTCSSELKQICNQEEEKMKDRQQLMHWTLTLTALAIHAFLEGLSVGMKTNLVEMWFLFLSAAFHSMSFCFCLGLELVLVDTKEHLIYLQMGLLATVNPIGLFIGIYVSFIPHSTVIHATQVILEGFSAGTILYVLFFQVLSREKNRRVLGVPRAVCMLLGFCSIAILEYGDTTFGAHL